LTLVPFMHNPRKALNGAVLGVAYTVLILCLATLLVLMAFGPAVSAQLRFPFFMFTRSIDILDFIQNVDVFVIFIWIFGVFAKLSLYLFITSYEMASWLHIKHWRNLIGFGATVVLILAVSIPDELMIQTVQNIWQYAIFPVCGVVIPTLLWMISTIRRKYARV